MEIFVLKPLVVEKLNMFSGMLNDAWGFKGLKQSNDNCISFFRSSSVLRITVLYFLSYGPYTCLLP